MNSLSSINNQEPKQQYANCKINNKTNNTGYQSVDHDRFNELDMLDVAENMTKQPAYMSQFEPSKFDMSDDPYSINQQTTGLEEGWSNYNMNDTMAYDAIPFDQIKLRSAVPYGSHKIPQNESLKIFKNELFTGRSSTWKKKKESKPMFDNIPENIYGTPIYDSADRDRMPVSRYHQNQLPFQPVHVGPGLGLKINETGRSNYRCLGKTLDELRIGAKQVLPGRHVDGMHGEKRTSENEVVQNRPTRLHVTDANNIHPTKSDRYAPTVQKSFVMRQPNRSTQHVEYTGGAYVPYNTIDSNVPESMRGEIRDDNRSTFTLPDPMQKFSSCETTHNPNLESYHLPFTTKDQQIENERSGTVYKSNITYANPVQSLKTTGRETSVESTQPFRTESNTMRGTAYNPAVLDSTLREINELNPNHHILSSTTQQTRTHLSQPTTTTMREATQPKNIHHILMPQNTAPTTYRNQPLAPTSRESLVFNTDALPSNFISKSVASDYSWSTLNPTLREQFTTIDPVFDNIGQSASTTSSAYPMSTTMREATLDENRIGNATKFTCSVQTSPNESLKTTGRETFDNTHRFQLQPTSYNTRVHDQMTPSTNLREINVVNKVRPGTSGTFTKHSVNPTIMLPTNLREIILENKTGHIIDPNAYGHKSNPTQFVDTTLKELISTNTRINNVQPNSHGHQAAVEYILPSTMRDSLIMSTRIGGASNESGSSVHRDELVAPTLRELLINNKDLHNVTSDVKSGQTQPNTMLPSTLRELITASNKPGMVSSQIDRPTVMQDQLKTTLREQNVKNDRQHMRQTNGLDADGLGYISSNVDLPSTIRESTIHNNYVQPLIGNEQPRNRNDVSNMVLNDNKQSLYKTRAPTTINVEMGPDPSRVNMELKNYENKVIDPIPNVTFNPQNTNLRQYMHDKQQLHVPNDRFIDMSIINQLKSNPYVLN